MELAWEIGIAVDRALVSIGAALARREPPREPQIPPAALAPSPASVRVQVTAAEIEAVRGEVERLDGRLAVISGRTLTDVDRILETCVTSVAAVHGLVRRGPDGQVAKAPPHPAIARAAEVFGAFAARDSGLIVEEKAGLSVALHYRLAPRCAEAAQACAHALAAETGLSLQEGDRVEELRAPGDRCSTSDSARRTRSTSSPSLWCSLAHIPRGAGTRRCTVSARCTR